MKLMVKVFMPCKTHEEYEAIKPKKSEKPKNRTNFPSPGDDEQMKFLILNTKCFLMDMLEI